LGVIVAVNRNAADQHLGLAVHAAGFPVAAPEDVVEQAVHRGGGQRVGEVGFIEELGVQPGLVGRAVPVAGLRVGQIVGLMAGRFPLDVQQAVGSRLTEIDLHVDVARRQADGRVGLNIAIAARGAMDQGGDQVVHVEVGLAEADDGEGVVAGLGRGEFAGPADRVGGGERQAGGHVVVFVQSLAVLAVAVDVPIAGQVGVVIIGGSVQVFPIPGGAGPRVRLAHRHIAGGRVRIAHQQHIAQGESGVVIGQPAANLRGGVARIGAVIVLGHQVGRETVGFFLPFQKGLNRIAIGDVIVGRDQRVALAVLRQAVRVRVQIIKINEGFRRPPRDGGRTPGRLVARVGTVRRAVVYRGFEGPDRPQFASHRIVLVRIILDGHIRIAAQAAGIGDAHRLFRIEGVLAVDFRIAQLGQRGQPRHGRRQGRSGRDIDIGQGRGRPRRGGLQVEREQIGVRRQSELKIPHRQPGIAVDQVQVGVRRRGQAVHERDGGTRQRQRKPVAGGPPRGQAAVLTDTGRSGFHLSTVGRDRKFVGNGLLGFVAGNERESHRHRRQQDQPTPKMSIHESAPCVECLTIP